MGQLVKIYLKDKSDKNIEKFNEFLNEKNIENSFTSYADMNDWAHDINTNPKSPQAHLKPTTADELIEMFSSLFEIGVMMFDVAYNRTSQSEASIYAEFILKHVDDIEYINGADELINRYQLSDNEINIIKSLIRDENILPEKLPIDKQYKPNLQSGLFLCKSFSHKPFWVIFGNVDKPTFLKEKIYVNDIYNNIYRDKNNYAYLMFPLMPLSYKKQVEFAYKIYDIAFDMGLRENPNFILPLIYGLDITDIHKVSDNFIETYTNKELIERFKIVLQITNNTFPYNDQYGFLWNDKTNRFKHTGTKPTQLLLSKINLLNALQNSINNKKIVIDIMSEITNHTFKEFEFIDK